MKKSENQCLAILETEGPQALTRYQIYRAQVVLANNGLVHAAEAVLDPQERRLLEVRRLMKNGRLSEAQSVLSTLNCSDSLQVGDRIFLLAAVSHRNGDAATARALYAESALHYGRGGDDYRRIRALINARISENNVDHYLAGPLFAIQQEAKRNGFYGLVGIIEKARAGELLSRGRFAEACCEAESAIESLSNDSCPEDLAVARLLAALAHLVTGNLEAAKSHFERVALQGGKLTAYQDTYFALREGKLPKIPKGHPLEGTPWPRFAVKQGAVPAKILRKLQAGPATPDELIEEVWGKNAIHPSYRNRLFVAISKLKKTSNQPIVFDGSAYRLK